VNRRGEVEDQKEILDFIAEYKRQSERPPPVSSRPPAPVSSSPYDVQAVRMMAAQIVGELAGYSEGQLRVAICAAIGSKSERQQFEHEVALARGRDEVVTIAATFLARQRLRNLGAPPVKRLRPYESRYSGVTNDDDFVAVTRDGQRVIAVAPKKR
jgi:hypothetical protein